MSSIRLSLQRCRNTHTSLSSLSSGAAEVRRNDRGAGAGRHRSLHGGAAAKHRHSGHHAAAVAADRRSVPYEEEANSHGRHSHHVGVGSRAEAEDSRAVVEGRNGRTDHAAAEDHTGRKDRVAEEGRSGSPSEAEVHSRHGLADQAGIALTWEGRDSDRASEYVHGRA